MLSERDQGFVDILKRKIEYYLAIGNINKANSKMVKLEQFYDNLAEKYRVEKNKLKDTNAFIIIGKLYKAKGNLAAAAESYLKPTKILNSEELNRVDKNKIITELSEIRILQGQTNIAYNLLLACIEELDILALDPIKLAESKADILKKLALVEMARARESQMSSPSNYEESYGYYISALQYLNLSDKQFIDSGIYAPFDKVILNNLKAEIYLKLNNTEYGEFYINQAKRNLNELTSHNEVSILETHPIYAHIYNNLALHHLQLARLSKLYQRVEEVDKVIFESTNLSQALNYSEKALNIQKSQLYKYSPEIANSFEILSSIYNYLGFSAKSAMLLYKAYEINLKINEDSRGHGDIVKTEFQLNKIGQIAPELAKNMPEIELIKQFSNAGDDPEVLKRIQDSIVKPVMNLVDAEDADKQLFGSTEYRIGFATNSTGELTEENNSNNREDGALSIKGYASREVLGGELDDLTSDTNIKQARKFVFEALNLAVAENNCHDTRLVHQFAKEFPELVDEIATNSPQYFVDGRIVREIVKNKNYIKTLIYNEQQDDTLEEIIYLDTSSEAEEIENSSAESYSENSDSGIPYLVSPITQSGLGTIIEEDGNSDVASDGSSVLEAGG